VLVITLTPITGMACPFSITGIAEVIFRDSSNDRAERP
jgi:K+-transporting ATPase c subunit